jgi:hypothetical protein
VDEGGDHVGQPVSGVASRLADAAGAGEVFAASLSEGLVQGSGAHSFELHRDVRLKGMARARPSATLVWAE